MNVRGEQRFEYDGASHVLSYSANALVTLEDTLGFDVMEIGEKLSDEGGGKKIRLLRTVFWAGLTDHDPDATETLAGLMLTELGVDVAGALVIEALTGAFPEAKDNGPRPPKPRAKKAQRG